MLGGGDSPPHKKIPLAAAKIQCWTLQFPLCSRSARPFPQLPEGLAAGGVGVADPGDVLTGGAVLQGEGGLGAGASQASTKVPAIATAAVQIHPGQP